MGHRQSKQPGTVRHDRGAAATENPERRQVAALAAALFVAAVATFAGSVRCGFVNFDDNLYVTEAPAVSAGLSWPTVKTAFTTYHVGNWHPLTTLSLALDATLGGLDPRRFHLHNLLLHAANTVLLLVVLRRMTGAFWRSGLVAALFALHPLHVESVAWIAERKDVLSAVLLAADLRAYVRGEPRRAGGRYLAAVWRVCRWADGQADAGDAAPCCCCWTTGRCGASRAMTGAAAWPGWCSKSCLSSS